VYYQDFMQSEEHRRAYWQQKLEDAESWGDAGPNEVHASIVALERAGKIEMVVTQNVDGLHSVAGTSPENLVEIHGTNRAVECQSCGERTDPAPHYAAFADTGICPTCYCGGVLKTATISFGQSLRSGDMARAYEAADRCDLVIALGSTLAVNPAASVPLYATERGTPYVIVNQGPTDHDQLRVVTLRIEDDVATVFPAAVAAALGDILPDTRH
jgi:NAD-dependent deacetylase